MDERHFNTVVLGQLDEGFLALTNSEDVGKASGESVAFRVPDVDNFVRTRVLLKMHKCADTTNVVSTSDEHKAAILELNNAIDFASLKVKLTSSNERY